MTTTNPPFPMEGGCTCRKIRYRMETAPLIIHCCHCTYCQRETGSSFALNALVEASRVTILTQEPQIIITPSRSGVGQPIARCPDCKVAVWSHYGAGPVVNFVRVGTLDRAGEVRPGIHIYAGTKQPWVMIPEGDRVVEAFYELEKEWSAESLERRKEFLPAVQAWRASLKEEGTK